MHDCGLLGRLFPEFQAISWRVVPVVRSDSEASGRFTILDIVARNAVGLLYRISRVISQHGCDVHLGLISTEGERAIDVFHVTKAGSKLTEAEQRALRPICRRHWREPYRIVFPSSS